MQQIVNPIKRKVGDKVKLTQKSFQIVKDEHEGTVGIGNGIYLEQLSRYVGKVGTITATYDAGFCHFGYTATMKFEDGCGFHIRPHWVESVAPTRPIEFRVWDSINKTYLDYDLFFNYRTFSRFLRSRKSLHIEEEGLIPQQYIGIEDKHAKKVYEGDIVKYSWTAGENEVEHDVGEIFFEEAIFYISKQDRFSWNDWNLRKDSIEVIGNIFENPELL